MEERWGRIEGWDFGEATFLSSPVGFIVIGAGMPETMDAGLAPRSLRAGIALGDFLTVANSPSRPYGRARSPPPGPERRRLLARQFRVRLAPPAADKSTVRTLDDGPAAQQGGVKPPAPADGRL